MALPHAPWQAYRQVALNTASPGQLVLMLFDGAIRFLEGARAGFALDDPLESITAIHNNVSRAQAIIHELNACLNMEAGGEIATNFRRLYAYFDDRLQEANQRKRSAGIDEVLRHLGTLRAAWAEMLRTKSDEVTEAESHLAITARRRAA